MNDDYIRVPYGSTVHGEEEIEAVIEVLKSTTQMGSKTQSFEKKVSNLFDKEYGLMVNSGSSALYLTIESLGNSSVSSINITFFFLNFSTIQSLCTIS